MIEIPENYTQFLLGLVVLLGSALIRVGVSEKLKKLETISTQNKEDIIVLKTLLKDYDAD